jgi:hypothetical protein
VNRKQVRDRYANEFEYESSNYLRLSGKRRKVRSDWLSLDALLVVAFPATLESWICASDWLTPQGTREARQGYVLASRDSVCTMQSSPVCVANEIVYEDSMHVDCVCRPDAFWAWLDWSGLLWDAGIGMGWWRAIPGFSAGMMRHGPDCIDDV